MDAKKLTMMYKDVVVQIPLTTQADNPLEHAFISTETGLQGVAITF